MNTKIISLILFVALYRFCPENDQRCAACDQRQNCLVCYDSFIDQRGQCQEVKDKIRHCLTYQKNGFCQYCQHGYKTDQFGNCIEIDIQNCAEIDARGNCTMCMHHLLIKNGKCDHKEKCSIKNCAFCNLQNGRENCVMCSGDFMLEEYNGATRCVQEQRRSQNCLYVNRYGTCSICDINYYYSKGQCVRSSQYELSLSDEYDKNIFQRAYESVTGFFSNLFG